MVICVCTYVRTGIYGRGDVHRYFFKEKNMRQKRRSNMNEAEGMKSFFVRRVCFIF